MACFLNIGQDRTRGCSWALAKERCKLDTRKYAFSRRTINEWNRPPSVNMFNYFLKDLGMFRCGL